MQNFLIKLLVAVLIRILKSNLLIREQHEVIDKDFCSFFKSVLGVNGTIRCNFNDEIIVVGLLLDTSRLNVIFYITDWGVDRIDWKYTDISTELTILISRNITTSLVNGQINLNRCLGV